MRAGDRVVLEAGDLAFGGETVCRAPDGRVVFVAGLAPGDRAVVRIDTLKASFGRGSVKELERRGPDRVDPPCPVFGTCGGCQWQHVALEAQRAAKERIVRHLLHPLGAADRVEPIVGVGDGFAYRNRLILPVRRGAAGGLEAGFFRTMSHDVVPVEACAVQGPELMAVAREFLELARAAGLTGYDERAHAGLIRHLVVRSAAGTGELGLVVVTTDAPFPGAADLAAELRRRRPAVAGVARSVNPHRTNVVLGEPPETLAGEPCLRERLGGLELRASLAAFFQTNVPVTERMLERIAGWTADETGGILDLYGGVGILGLAAARAGSPAWLVGVEEHPAAVADARANAAAVPGLAAEFHAGTVEAVLPGLRDRLAGLGTVLVDPPRKGLEPAARAAVAALPARRLIYVSCDPATFARDARELLAAGWELEAAVPLDMFPQTYHIEVLAIFRRREGSTWTKS